MNLNFARRALRGGTALQALALLGAGVGTIAAAAPAAAQDYTSGAIGGTVKDEAGNPVNGATVTITSRGQGVTRTATTGSDGGFLVNGLAAGGYDVTVQSSATASYKADNVPLQPGQTAQLNVQLAAAGGDDIVVTGTRAVASFAGTTTGLNVDVSDFIKSRPLARNLTSVILLAPKTTLGDGAFGNLPSIGGSSVAENAYYFNGLNLTNFDTGLGSAQVPFYFYKNVEVKTGGYAAEFGRATGGFINAVSKSGSNEFTAEFHVDWIPNFLRSLGKDTQISSYVNYPTNLAVTTVDNSRVVDNRANSLLATVGVGGPVIKDHLFFYGMAQFTRTSSTTVNPNSGTATQNKNDDPFWGVKIDAFPIDSQHFEATIFDTRNTTQQSIRDYSVTTGLGSANTIRNNYGGGLNYVGKYTGRFTDWLTVSAAYGRVRDRADYAVLSGNTTTPVFTNSSGTTTYGVASGGFYNAQRLGSIVEPYDTERKFFRADADVRFNLLGDHHIRGGYDQEINTLRHVTVNTGAASLVAAGLESNTAVNALLGGAGYQIIARAAAACAAGQVSGVSCGPIVELNYFNTGGAFKGTNKAYYVQDEWKPFDRLTLTLGARRDDFRIEKPSGAPIADLKKNYAPRVGAQYLLFGDKSGKVYGSYGWYYLPIASNTAYRQGAPSYYFRQRYYLNGITASGLPILGNLVTNQGTYQTACPFALLPNGATTNCNVTGDGADINTTQAISSNLKPTREDEIVVGYEQKVGLWTFGLDYTHRNLKRTSEDSAIDAAVNAYCAANNIRATPTRGGASVPCSSIWTGYHQYVINNPGQDIVVNLLANGYDINNRTVTLSGQSLGYGPAKRTYDAVTFSFNRGFDGFVSFGGSYTWSKSKGNIEGGVQSDFGQTDTGITQDFDQPGFVPGSYGYLPNDHRHQFKLFGNVAPTDQFSIGANIQVQSPRSLSCFGYNPTDDFANGYDAASHYCGLKLSPRGTAQKTDWFQTINLSFRYSPQIAGREITLRADVFNLLNSQNVTKRYEIGDLVGSNVAASDTNPLPVSVTRDPQYGAATAYQAPRYVQVGFDIAF